MIVWKQKAVQLRDNNGKTTVLICKNGEISLLICQPSSCPYQLSLAEQTTAFQSHER